MSDLAGGVSSVLPMPCIPVRQKVLAIQSFQSALNGNIMVDRSLFQFPEPKTIAHARDKQEHIDMPSVSLVLVIIVELLNRAVFRLTEIISGLDHPEQDPKTSLSFTSGPGLDLGREATRSMTLRLTMKKGRVFRRFEDLIFTTNKSEMTIGDLFALPMLSDGSRIPEVDDCIADFIRAGTKELRRLGEL